MGPGPIRGALSRSVCCCPYNSVTPLVTTIPEKSSESFLFLCLSICVEKPPHSMRMPTCWLHWSHWRISFKSKGKYRTPSCKSWALCSRRLPFMYLITLDFHQQWAVRTKFPRSVIYIRLRHTIECIEYTMISYTVSTCTVCMPGLAGVYASV